MEDIRVDMDVLYTPNKNVADGLPEKKQDPIPAIIVKQVDINDDDDDNQDAQSPKSKSAEDSEE